MVRKYPKLELPWYEVVHYYILKGESGASVTHSAGASQYIIMNSIDFTYLFLKAKPEVKTEVERILTEHQSQTERSQEHPDTSEIVEEPGWWLL